MLKQASLLTVAIAASAAMSPLSAQDAAGQGMSQPQFMERAGKMFARMDANGDGVINAADREARRDARFARLDTNKDGELSAQEMTAAREQRQAMRAERRSKRLENRIERLDADNSGGVSQGELAAARERRAERMAQRGTEKARWAGKRGGRMGLMAGLAKQADSNGDKAITRAEFDAAVQQRFQSLDTNRDGTISPEERRAGRQAMRALLQRG